MKKITELSIVLLIVCNCALAGQAGSALRFDGVNDYVHAPYISAYQMPVFTYEAWVYTTQDTTLNPDCCIIARGEDAANDHQAPELLVYNASSGWGHGFTLEYETNSDADYVYSANVYPPINSWTHVAATRTSSGQLSIYVNGSLIQQWNSTPIPASDCLRELTIGAIWHKVPPSVLRKFWAGAIDEVRIWNVARTAEEIVANYNRKVAPDSPGLIGYWDFDDGAGTIAADLTGRNNATLGLNGTGADVPEWIDSTVPLVPKSAADYIQEAIDEKIKALEIIDTALDKEDEASVELEKALENKDYGDLQKGDIVKAKEKIHSAIQHEEQSQKDLEKSIEKLEDALEALGVEPEPEPQLDPNLIAWWKLDDGLGSFAIDALGNSNGTLYDNTQWVPGKIGPTALSFDGSGDYVDCGNNLNLGTSNFTISAWINVRSVPTGLCPGIVSKWQDLNNRWYFHVFGPDYIQFTSKTSGNFVYYVNTDHFLSFNQWYHVCFVADGLGKIYVNGQDRTASASYSPASLSNNATLKMGYNGYSGIQQYLDGVIDDVRIYNKALSAEEVQTLYQAGL